MDKTLKLKDGTDVVIRKLGNDDVDRSFDFFNELPREDRAYLRVDVTRREIVELRINAIDDSRIIRLAALVDGQIVADGALELEGHGWKDHVGEIRLIVARPYQRKGLGMLMARELYMLAAGQKVEEIVVKIMEPQIGALSIFERLGFKREALLHDYVRDIKGAKRNLILMRCDLESLWQKLDNYIANFDWQRTR
ncbi:MAG: GNAT family N-acetyltransferase [candidate division Zixibacteria bacterium]